ncbi:MAG: winged helix DNA-binding protein [Bacteroidales bacterium]
MNSICVMREIYKALETYEKEFENRYGICLNEAMALCSLAQETERLSASEIAAKTGMSNSHTSKVIKQIECKEMISRSLGTEDKRQMYFALTEKGEACLQQISCSGVAIPKILRPIFESLCDGHSK